MNLSPFQQECLTTIERELKANPAYAAWMRPSYIMALIQEESSWNKDIASADGLGSIGLMQPLPATVAEAKAAGVQAGSMHDPVSNIRVGLFCFQQKHNFLKDRVPSHLGRPMTLEDVVAAYNEGEGNVIKGRADQPYVDRFHRYQAMFSFADQVMDGHDVEHQPLPHDGDLADPAPAAAEPEKVEEEAPAPEPQPSAAPKKSKGAVKAEEPDVQEGAGGDEEQSADDLNRAELAREETDPAIQAALAAAKGA